MSLKLTSISLLASLVLAALVSSTGREAPLPQAVALTEQVKGEAPRHLTWNKLDGKSYGCEAGTLSAEQVQQLREVVLASEHQGILEGFGWSSEELIEPTKSLYPWVDLPLPKPDERKLQSSALAIAKRDDNGGWRQKFSLRATLVGETEITVRCEDALSLEHIQSYRLSLPLWHISAGDQKWLTRSPRIAEALLEFCAKDGTARASFASLEQWLENFQTSEAQWAGRNWARAYLLKSHRRWAHFTELDLKLKLTGIWPTPTTIRFEFEVREPDPITHVVWHIYSREQDHNAARLVSEQVANRYISLAEQHGYLYDPHLGPEQDWTPLLTELQRAEEMVAHHKWIRDLVRKGVVSGIRLTPINKLALKDWPFEAMPDCELELAGDFLVNEILFNSEARLAYAPLLDPAMCTALPVPGYSGPGPQYSPEGLPVFPLRTRGASALIKSDGTATLVRNL